MEDLVRHAGGTEGLRDLVAAFDEFGALIKESTSGAYEALVTVTADRLPGAECASVTTLHAGTFRTEASSAPLAEQADALQYALGSGPCVDAVVEHSVFHTNHLKADVRWPGFAEKASSDLGIGSVLSYRLLIDDEDTVAGLNIYSTQLDAFDEASVTRGFLLATHGAVAVNAAQRQEHVENLRRALETNRVIATAVGIVMAQHGLTRDQAFNVLAVASQRSNRKLHAIAEGVIEKGTLHMDRAHQQPSRQPVESGRREDFSR